MSEEQTKKSECQAVDCGNYAVDEMGLFCDTHWSKLPPDIKALLTNLYDSDVKSKKHMKWVHEVRKVVIMLMAEERGLTRNKEGKNLDAFPKADPCSVGTVNNPIAGPVIDVEKGDNGQPAKDG
ncbi:MAG: hypothetical protein ACWGQW_09610 [bacterium]